MDDSLVVIKVVISVLEVFIDCMVVDLVDVLDQIDVMMHVTLVDFNLINFVSVIKMVIRY